VTCRSVGDQYRSISINDGSRLQRHHRDIAQSTAVGSVDLGLENLSGYKNQGVSCPSSSCRLARHSHPENIVWCKQPANLKDFEHTLRVRQYQARQSAKKKESHVRTPPSRAVHRAPCQAEVLNAPKHTLHNFFDKYEALHFKLDDHIPPFQYL
jgi:hypothetical protein